MILQVGMDQARFDKLLFHEYLSLMDTLTEGSMLSGECFGCFCTRMTHVSSILDAEPK